MAIRIFIGTSANDEDLEFQSVLEYSLRKHHPADDLDITWMRLSRDPASFWYSNSKKKTGWSTKSYHTPFSALRWGVPAACNYEGKAIYLDVDMIAMADIAELWNQPFQTGAAMISRNPAICVCMYDNLAMKALLPPIEQIRQVPGLYRDLRQRMLNKPGAIQRYTGGNWNCLDLKKENGGEYASVTDPEIKVLHFTEVPTQPHLRHAIPRLAKEGRQHWYMKNAGVAAKPVHDHHRKDALAFFDTMLAEAQVAGYTLDKYRNPTPFGEYGR